MKAVKLTVNGNDASGVIAGVNLYAKNLSFSNNYALKFDLWINYPGAAGGSGSGVTGSTQYAISGVNHLGTQPDWGATSATATDGIWFGVDGEGGTTRDYRAYVGNTNGVQTELSIGSPTASGLSATNSDATIFQTAFPSSQFESAGAPGKSWVACELIQTNNNLFWKINGSTIASRTNTSSFTSGTIMLGLMDIFSSVANPVEDSFVLFDNVRVENLGAAAILPPIISSPPQSTNASAGGSVGFAITVGGSSPFLYQWMLNGAPIASATNATLVLTNVQMPNLGSYSVQVSNAAGSVLSGNAILGLTSNAATLVSPQKTSNQFRVNVAGLSNAPCVLDASTNLSAWISVQTSTPPFLYIDSGMSNMPRRFFRVRQQL
jgi:hypothetical protein